MTLQILKMKEMLNALIDWWPMERTNCLQDFAFPGFSPMVQEFLSTSGRTTISREMEPILEVFNVFNVRIFVDRFGIV
jgi:hypothetical protein